MWKVVTQTRISTRDTCNCTINSRGIHEEKLPRGHRESHNAQVKHSIQITNVKLYRSFQNRVGSRHCLKRASKFYVFRPDMSFGKIILVYVLNLALLDAVDSTDNSLYFMQDFLAAFLLTLLCHSRNFLVTKQKTVLHFYTSVAKRKFFTCSYRLLIFSSTWTI